MFLALADMQLIGAGRGVAAPEQGKVQPSANHVLIADEESCQAFVQEFYDWYWNRFAERAESPEFSLRELPTYHDVARRMPAVLSPELIRLIKRDEAAAKAAGGIANLDFDPFLNSQEANGKYLATQVTVTNGVCNVSLSQRYIVAELKRSGMAWKFSNFHYSFFSDDGKTKQAPDSDLIQILRQ